MIPIESASQDFNRIDIVPSKIDDILQKACPCAGNESEAVSSLWNFLHQVFNARLAQDLKKAFGKFNVQHEVVEGNSRLDIRLVTDYQNKVMVGGKNLVVIDLKTGHIKLYQLCLYAIRNKCPVLIVELLSGDVHIITTEAAGKILMNMPSEIEKIKELKRLNATLPGQDCKFCGRDCKDRITKYSPYKVSSTTLAERATILESNYSNAKVKVQQIIESMIEETMIKVQTDKKEVNITQVSIASEAGVIQAT